MNAIPNDGADDVASEAEEQSLWKELGVQEPEYLDERLAPPVDRELLRRLVRQELSETAARAVSRMIVTFAGWRDAHVELLLEEVKSRPPDGDEA